MRRAARRDNNEKDIIQALEAVGAKVICLSIEDVPDILCGYKGRNWLLEVKNRQGKNKLSDGQVEFQQLWPGQRAVVRSPDEALKAIGASICSAPKDSNEHWSPDQYRDHLLRERAGMK